MCSYHPNPGSHHDYAIIIIVATIAVPHATAPATPARQHPPRAAGRRRRGVPRRHLLVVDAWCRPATRASTSSFAAPPRCRLVGARSSPAWRRRAKGARRSHPLSRTAACHGRPKTPRQRMQRRRLGVAPRWWWRCERNAETFFVGERALRRRRRQGRRASDRGKLADAKRFPYIYRLSQASTASRHTPAGDRVLDLTSRMQGHRTTLDGQPRHAAQRGLPSDQLPLRDWLALAR